mmetsp:Transcript_25915/g.56560  ORF Transcript_25915/g.56560 Transcript_25915/m.56560 type:complete len:200 (+) Transcript_25915:2018-2617(+)
MRSTRSPCAATARSKSSVMVCVTRTSEEQSNCSTATRSVLAKRCVSSSMAKVFPAPGGDTTMTTQGSGISRRLLNSSRKSRAMLLVGNSSKKSQGKLLRKKAKSPATSPRQSPAGGQCEYSVMWLGLAMTIRGFERSAVERIVAESISGAKEKLHLSRFSEKFQEVSTFSKKTKRQGWCRVYSANHFKSASSTTLRPWM